MSERVFGTELESKILSCALQGVGVDEFIKIPSQAWSESCGHA